MPFRLLEMETYNSLQKKHNTFMNIQIYISKRPYSFKSHVFDNRKLKILLSLVKKKNEIQKKIIRTDSLLTEKIEAGCHPITVLPVVRALISL